ncbi:MAG: hypothetical protein ACFFFC_16425 [Candidatus Thorarchaeota archaeon]
MYVTNKLAKAKYIAMVTIIIAVLTTPQLVTAGTLGWATRYDAAYDTFYGEENNGVIIYCHADGSGLGRAVIYKTVTPSTSGKIEVGVRWTLSGFMIAHILFGTAAWQVNYYWARTGDDFDNSASYHSAIVDSDSLMGGLWWETSKSTHGSKVEAYYYGIATSVPANEEIHIGIKITFTLSGTGGEFCLSQYHLDEPLFSHIYLIVWRYQ